LGLANAFMERLVNAVIKPVKNKTDTEISSGATSVSLPQFVILSTMYKTLETKTFSCLVLEKLVEIR
jgi:hypothetical protein